MMNLLLDICIGIFLLFNILYAIRLKTLDYLQVIIVYVVPFVIIYFLMPVIYPLILTNWDIPLKLQTAFSGNTHVIVYFAVEVVLFIIFAILLKVICYFTLDKILLKSKEVKPSALNRLINLPLALIVGFAWSFVLIFILSRLGITYQGTLSQKVVEKTSIISEIGTLNEYSRSFEVYQSAKNFEVYLLNNDVLDERVDTFIEEMLTVYQSLKDNMSGPQLGEVDTYDDEIEIIYNILNDGFETDFTSGSNNYNKALRDLEDYKGFVNALYTIGDSDLNELIQYLITNEVNSESRSVNKKLTEIKDVFNKELNLTTFVKNFLDIPVNADMGSYRYYVQQLLNEGDYQFLLKNYLQEYPDLFSDVSSQYLVMLTEYQINDSSTLTLKEQYFKNELFDVIFPKVLDDKNNGIVLPLIDDMVQDETDLSLILTLIKEEYPTLTNEELASTINTFNITNYAKAIIVNAVTGE